MRTLLLLFVTISLLLGSASAVAHVDGPAPMSSHAAGGHGGSGDVPSGDDGSGARGHCDLCAHAFGHLAVDLPLAPAVRLRGVVQIDAPALPRAATRPDLQDRPPK